MQSVRGSSFLNADFGRVMIEGGKASASLPAGRQENRLCFPRPYRTVRSGGLFTFFAQAKKVNNVLKHRSFANLVYSL